MMENVKEFFNKYKTCILPLMLLIIFFTGVFLSWGKWGHMVYDCFREAVLPGAVLEGKVFYRDITNLYPPLAYYFNALLYSIFGNSLTTLYWAAIINSVIILSAIYLIVKKISSDLAAFITVLTIMEIFVFRVTNSSSTSSWLFPYSYSFIYAFCACLLSLLAYILYRENKKPEYLLSSFFLIGLSAAFKLDFILFTVIPLIGAVKSKSFKTVLKGLGCFTAPIAGMFLIYFLTGGTFDALYKEAIFLNNFSKAPSVKIFNEGVLPQSFKPWVLKHIQTSLFSFLLYGGILFSYIYFSINKISKLKNMFSKIATGTVFLLIGLFIVKVISIFQMKTFYVLMDLSFVSYFVTISAVIIFLAKVIKYKRLNFTHKEKTYFLIAFCSWLISFRSYTLLCLAYIGNFMLIPWWIGFIYFFLQLLPEYSPFIFKKELTNKVKAALCIFFIMYSMYFVYIFINYGKKMPYRINTSKGTLYVEKRLAKTVNDTLLYIQNEIPKDKKILIAEEGLIFNYLADREANLKYYALIPHMIDTFGEENIISDLAKNPPDYMLVANSVYVTKAGGVFGNDYGKKIAMFIIYNYDYVKTIKDPEVKRDGFEITVFKLKKDKIND